MSIASTWQCVACGANGLGNYDDLYMHLSCCEPYQATKWQPRFLYPLPKWEPVTTTRINEMNEMIGKTYRQAVQWFHDFEESNCQWGE